MENTEGPCVFRGNRPVRNPTKIGVQRPNPLKSSTEIRLSYSPKQVIPQRNHNSEKYSPSQHNPINSTVNDIVVQVQDVQQLFDKIVNHLSAKLYKTELVSAIINLNSALKFIGEQIEALDKERMNRYQGILREACKSSELDLVARLQLLEIVELRSVKWKPNADVSNYYRHKLEQIEQKNATEALEAGTSQLQCRVEQSIKVLSSTTLNANAPDFIPPSASDINPVTKELKNMKVEIPLQKPYANQRRVKLVGPEANNSKSTKYLVADSMNQTNSPAPPPSPSGDSYNCNRLSGDYVYTVPVGNGNYINIQGNDPELTKAANSILRDFFNDMNSKKPECTDMQKNQKKTISFAEAKERYGNLKVLDTNLTYDRESLLKWADSPLAKQLPTHWSLEWKKVQDENPALFNQVISPQPINLDKKQAPSQKFLRSKNDDKRSLDVNQSTADSSFRRERTIGGRKHDNNNNHPNKQLMKSKSESRWDDATEKWVQVNGSLEDADTDN